MALYQYELVVNESAMFAEEGSNSANYQFPYSPKGTVNASSFEEAYQELKSRWLHLSNGDWDWETDDENSEDGRIWFTNDLDCLEVRFRILCIDS